MLKPFEKLKGHRITRDNYISSLVLFCFIKSVLSTLQYLPGGGSKQEIGVLEMVWLIPERNILWGI